MATGVPGTTQKVSRHCHICAVERVRHFCGCTRHVTRVRARECACHANTDTHTDADRSDRARSCARHAHRSANNLCDVWLAVRDRIFWAEICRWPNYIPIGTPDTPHAVRGFETLQVGERNNHITYYMRIHVTTTRTYTHTRPLHHTFLLAGKT